MQNLVALASLLRHLGPWAREDAALPSRRAPFHCDGVRRSIRGYVYTPLRPIRGAYVVVPGLHPEGPDDPRLDRFCRALSASGTLVLCPTLPSHAALEVSPDAARDLALALDAFAPTLASHRLGAPSLFSISFGSLPAITLAASDRPIAALVLFGGFCDLDATMRFALEGSLEARDGRPATPSDPLNHPALYLNLLPFLDVDPHDRPQLALSWRRMVRLTWGQMHLKQQGARDAIAQRLAADLPRRLHRVFLEGCGIEHPDRDAIERALAACARHHDHARADRLLPRVRCPVAVVHGRDDDVIPHTEAAKIVAALSPGVPRRLLVTGLYGHTGAERAWPLAMAREAKTMLSLVSVLSTAPQGVV